MEKPQDIILRTENLSKRYGERWAVRDLNLSIPRGDVFGFLGPNGAGKTTTIRMALGLIAPTSGNVYVNGVDMRKSPMDALGMVGAIVETPAFYGYLTGRENLRLLARVSGGVSDGRVEETLLLVGLSNRADDKVKGYSQGMRQRLGIAQALLSEPELVVLDEPTNGLDPSGMREIRELIRSLAGERGITIFISSHLLGEVEAVCRHVAIINHGSLVAQGPVEELLRRESVRLDVEVSDSAAAKAILGGLGFISELAGIDGGFSMRLHMDRVAEVNRALVTGGVDVSSLTPNAVSLEEFFLEQTEGVSGDSGGVRKEAGA